MPLQGAAEGKVLMQGAAAGRHSELPRVQYSLCRLWQTFGDETRESPQRLSFCVFLFFVLTLVLRVIYWFTMK